MFSSACVLLALTSSSLATVFLTSPTAQTTFTGGQQSTISWIDNGSPPSLSTFGPASIGIFTGNAIQQTLLQPIVPSVSVGTTSTVQFTPDPNIGPNGNEYFIRIESLSFIDANTTFPAESFSAKFTMAGMTGTFNSTVQAQINGQSTAPIGGPTASASKASSSPTTTPATAAHSSTSTAKPTSSNAASHLTLSGTGALLVSVAAVFGIVF